MDSVGPSFQMQIESEMKHHGFKNKEIETIFGGFPEKVAEKLLSLRELIFQVAEEHDEIGQIEEAVKWGNPSYLTKKPKSGTTIRLSSLQANERKLAISVHCQTSLISEFREIYPELNYDGNRSVILDAGKKLPVEALRHIFYLALTYHYRKRHG